MPTYIPVYSFTGHRFTLICRSFFIACKNLFWPKGDDEIWYAVPVGTVPIVIINVKAVTLSVQPLAQLGHLKGIRYLGFNLSCSMAPQSQAHESLQSFSVSLQGPQGVSVVLGWSPATPGRFSCESCVSLYVCTAKGRASIPPRRISKAQARVNLQDSWVEHSLMHEWRVILDGFRLSYCSWPRLQGSKLRLQLSRVVIPC